jgi:glycosyltransferase EpsE
MGIYNCAPTLAEALDSLYAQTFQDFKIILCEDGSTDDTYNVAKSYADKHDNIVLVRNEKNMGLNYTLNHCLEHADTEYCARMDGDDISLPTRFEKEIEFLDEHPEYAIVTTPMKHFDENGIYRVGKGGFEPKLTDFPKYSPFCHAPCMVRTEAYRAVEGYTVAENLLREEDYHLWIKMYQKGFRGYTLKEPLYMMRDDRNAAKRRTFKARKNEAYVKHLAVKMLGLPFYYHVYCLKPLILGIMPTWLYNVVYKMK